jgi:hypothetical protein
MTMGRGYFRGFTAAEKTGTFGIGGSVRKALEFKPQQKE